MRDDGGFFTPLLRPAISWGWNGGIRRVGPLDSHEAKILAFHLSILKIKPPDPCALKIRVCPA